MDADRLRTVLAGLGTAPSTLEIAEILWLSAHMSDQRPAPERREEPSPAPESEDVTPPDQDLQEEPAPPRHPDVPEPPDRSERRGVHVQDDDEPDVDALVRETMVPTAPMLAETLAIQRSLRPLRRRVASRRLMVLDERATADRLARDRDLDGPWPAVMTAAEERLLGLLLIVDTGPSMGMWRPLGRELHETLARTGSFRDTKVMYLSGGAVGASPGGPFRDAATLIDPTGRQVVLVLSDCSGAHWWTGAAPSALCGLALSGPLAIVQTLPERLWGRTASPATPGHLLSRRPFAPNSALDFVSYDGDPGPALPRVAVPVLDYAPHWFANWAAVVSGTGGARIAAVTSFGPDAGPPAPVEREQQLPIETRVHRFQATASQEAVRLAAHVAVSFPVLPVMRLIQREVLPGSTPGSLAEVLLSGLLRPREDRPHAYDFVPGARERLLAMLPRSEAYHTSEVLDRLSRAIERRAGRGAEMFRATVPAEDGTASAGSAARPFALVSTAALRMITRTAPAGTGPSLPQGPPLLRAGGHLHEVAGRYRLLDMRADDGGTRTWQATDGAADLVVKEIPIRRDAAEQAAVRERLAECVAKAPLLGPGAVRYLDLVEDANRMWLVMESSPGLPLSEVLRSRGRLRWEPAADIGRQLAETLTACASAGLVHGSIGAEEILIDLDTGVVTLGGFENAAIGDRPADPSFADPARSPEAPLTAANDLWSTAIALYLIVEGELPFPQSGARDGVKPPTALAGPLRVPLRQLLHTRPELRMPLPSVLRLLTSLSNTALEGEPAAPSDDDPWITMWGPPGSGKTTLLGALTIATTRLRDSWKVVGTDLASTDALTTTTTMLATQRRFPSATTSMAGYRWQLIGHDQTVTGFLRRRRESRTVRIGLNIFDPPGELLLTQGSEGPTGQDMFEDLARSRGIVYIFDPIREYEEGDAFHYLNNMLSQVSVRLRGSRDFTSDGRLPHHLAVCLTKFDDFRVFASAERLGLLSDDPEDTREFPHVPLGDAQELFDRLCDVSSGNAAQIRTLLDTFFLPERVKYFVTSAIGFYLPPERGVFDRRDFENVVTGTADGAEPRIRGQIHPINVLEPLLWLGGRLSGTR